MTISRFENGHSGGQAETLRKLQVALERAGLEFLPEGDAGAGIRFRSKPSPYSYFPFPIFEAALSFGKGRFGIYRPDDNYNQWRHLTLLQLTNPARSFVNVFDEEYFWREELNRGDTLNRVLCSALEKLDGPRKPAHPSEVKWSLMQPEAVYPKARFFMAEFNIDWNSSPAQITTPRNPDLVSVGHRARLILPDARNYEWWRLDEL